MANSHTLNETQVADLTNFLTRLAEKKAAPIVCVWSVTHVDMLKKKRGSRKADGLACPYKLCVRKAAGSFQLAREEGGYGRRTNATLVRMGLEPTFKADQLWWGKGLPGDVPFTAKHATTGEVYLVACTPTNGQPVKSVDVWEVDGVVLEGEALKQFKQEWVADVPSTSKKQEEAGITDPAKQSVPRTYHIEGIVAIESGDIRWSMHDGAYGV